MDTLSLLRSGKLAGSKRLDLSCALTHFPGEIYDLADTLEILNLSGNQLCSLPDDLPRLHKLRVIFCSDNQFVEVPEVLGRCPSLEMIGFKANRITTLPAASLPQSLRWLILTDNRLGQLPPELGRCTRLQKLMLAGNLLYELPEQLRDCRNLELLRISANRLEALPAWLLTMPRLAWLAFSGNPFAEPKARDSADIRWQDLDVQHKLGEGASGVIHQAIWRGELPVAVKLFKGELTSDGLPSSEKAACLAAGAHPNLIAALGRVSGHPEGSRALVMPLVDARYKNLAGPPSLESCTRDIYPDELSFTLEAVISMASGIAAAAGHLHRNGIMHGDLYAHNMLWNEQDCLLGDFGAASFMFSDQDTLQRIEVRAFGCFLEELLLRCQDAPQRLWQLQRDCTRENAADRPSFELIGQSLSEFSGPFSAQLQRA